MNIALQFAPIQFASRIRRSDELVLGAMPLKPDTDRTTLSVFGDDRWDLSPAIFRENAHRGEQVLDFSTIADPVLLITAKEYLWARLNARPKPGRHKTVIAPITARTVLRSLLRFARFVEGRNGSFDMQAVDQALLDAYLAHVRNCAYRPAVQIARVIDIPIDLNRHAEYLTLGGFSCRPWNGRNAHQIAGCQPKPSTENRTPRIPEPVIAALLSWSLKYVNVFAADIFAARLELDQLEQRAKRASQAMQPIVASYVGQRCLEGRGIPVSTDARGGQRRTDRTTGEPEPAINYSLIALQLGCTKMHLLDPRSQLRAMLVTALKRLGSEIGGMNTPVTVDPDTGRPWRDRFDGPMVQHEEKMLQAACFVVCAYLTGMHDSEVQAMRIGCHAVSKSADGLIQRHKIVSRAYKGYGGRPLRTEWVTIAPVGRAIAVIEKLTHRQRTKRGSNALWQVLKTTAQAGTHLSTRTTALVNSFHRHLDKAYGTTEAPAIPHVDGKPWHFTVTQFRRTVAWYIANRPFGTVAGKIQYKHASIAMFEGYAGGSLSGFRREVDQERALGQLDDIVEHYEDFRRGLRPTGPASARLLTEFAHVQREVGDLPGRIVDHKRLRAMLSHLARTLHVGFLNDCFFEPATALCLDRSGTNDRSAPVLAHCSPDKCPNSCITRKHLAPWSASIAEADTLLKDKRLSSLQRKALVADNKRKRMLIAPLTNEAI